MKPMLVALVASTVLSSCADNSDVEKDWGETMARYKMIGVFPIKEDLEPGNVLLDVPPANSSDPQPQIRRLGSLDPHSLIRAIKQQDSLRLRFEGIKLGAPAKAGDKPGAVDTAAGKPVASTKSKVSPPATAAANKPNVIADLHLPASPQVLDADSPQSAQHPTPRFRRAALPGIIAARVYNWQIAGAGPLGRLAIGLGLSGNGSAAVLITLRGVETLEFDALAARRLLEDNIVPWLRQSGMTPESLLYQVKTINPDPVARICQGLPPPGDDSRALLRVVNRVMYAHQIQYEYTRTSDVAGRLALDISQLPASDPTRPLVPAAGATSAQPGATTSVTTSGAAIDAENARLNGQQNALAAASQSVPGVRTTFGIGTYGNAALNETYQQPMAVGFNVVTNWAIGDVIVAFGTHQAESDRQLEDARLLCSPAMTSPPPSRSPVEEIICQNTRLLHQRQTEPNGIVLPRRCSPDVERNSVLPAGLSTPFRPIGAQSRDLRSRAF